MENTKFIKGDVPITVLMISLNEDRNLPDVLKNLSGWANEVILLDSYSNDKTVDIALSFGIKVFQRKFKDFGDQWNFAISMKSISNPWIMKLDPDERLSDELKDNIKSTLKNPKKTGYEITRSLWFMGKRLHVNQSILRIWKKGSCSFSNVTVNEHPLINGSTGYIKGNLDHYDSPDLHHWLEKQNKYSSLEAINSFTDKNFAVQPRLFGNKLERRIWFKKIYSKIPFRHLIYFTYCLLVQGSIRSGYIGYIWAKLRVSVFKMRELKLLEMKLTNTVYNIKEKNNLIPDTRVKQY